MITVIQILIVCLFAHRSVCGNIACQFVGTAGVQYGGTKIKETDADSTDDCANECFMHTKSMHSSGVCASAAFDSSSNQCLLYSDNLDMFPETVKSLLIKKAETATYIQNVTCASKSIAKSGLELEDKDVYSGLSHCGMDVQTRLSKDSLTMKPDRVVGGIESKPNGWPWLVEFNYYGRHWCGGSLIRVDDHMDESDIVISAEHCFRSENPAKFEVVIGQFSRSASEGTEQTRKIRAIRWPGFPSKVDGDIVVIKLDRPVKFRHGGRPVCLPLSADMNPKAGHKCVSTGWGLTKNGTYPDRPREVALPIYDDAKCTQDYTMQRSVDPRVPLVNSTKEICGGFVEGGQDSCQGDSGGPFVCRFSGTSRWTLTGVVSWGGKCGRASSPGVYVKVSNWLPWIKNTVAQLSSVGGRKRKARGNQSLKSFFSKMINKTHDKWKNMF